MYYIDDVHVTCVLNVIPRVVSRGIHNFFPWDSKLRGTHQRQLRHPILLLNNLAHQGYRHSSVRVERRKLVVVFSVTSVYCVDHISRVFLSSFNCVILPHWGNGLLFRVSTTTYRWQFGCWTVIPTTPHSAMWSRHRWERKQGSKRSWIYLSTVRYQYLPYPTYLHTF